MSTTLLNAEIQLSKDMGDYFASDLTADGNAGGTTIVDDALAAYGTGFVSKGCWDMITSGTYDEEERKVSSLSASTLTTLAHGGKLLNNVTYRIHRVASASAKRIALIEACNDVYPYLHQKVRDDRERGGNLLRNGYPSVWTLTTIPDNWVKSALTCAENTTAPYYGSRYASAMKLDTAAGYVYQSETENIDLWKLAGKTVTFEIEGFCDTADCLRIAIYDGTDTTYSDYHDGDSAWSDTKQNKLWVQATIAEEPTTVEFRVYHAKAAGTSYVYDMFASGPRYEKMYVGHLNLAQNEPMHVYQQRKGSLFNEPWYEISTPEVDENGWMYLPEFETGNVIRVQGIGYLDFLSSGAASTAWDATVNVNSPQLKILTAQAGLYLYGQYIMPNMTTGNEESYFKGLSYFQKMLKDRKTRYSMPKENPKSDFGARY